MLKKQKHQCTTGKANCQTKNINEGACFAFPQIAQGEFDIGFEHNEQVIFKNRMFRLK
jgi:hypothetical protein